MFALLGIDAESTCLDCACDIKLRNISLSYVVSLIGFFLYVLLNVHISVILVINLLAPEFFYFILAHPVHKM